MTTILHTLRDSFTPLRLPNLRTYLSGQVISLLGTWMQITAQGWLVWKLTESKVALGVASMLGTLPLLLFGLFAGVWVDRLDRRKILIGSQISAMILAFILAALVATGVVQLWHVYALSFLLGCVMAFDFPAQQAFLGDLSGMGEVRKAVVVNAMIVQVARMLGPALAGFVIDSIGVAIAFLLNGLSFIAVLVSLFIVRTQQQRSPHTGNPVQAVIDGLRFIKSQRRIQDIILYAVLVVFFGITLLNFFPALADDVLHGDAQTLGLLLASSGAGALIGATIVAPLAQRARRTGLMMGMGVIWSGLWWTLASQSRSIPLSMLLIFLGSWGVPAVLTTANGLLQVMAPPLMRGRLLAAYIIVSFGIQPISAAVIGVVAQAVGIATAMLLCGLALIFSAGLMLTFRSGLRTWAAPHASEPAVGHESL
ncbi:Putative bacilysin exporter BacE [Thermoflexales bacterium]|nr:Putative bacilysin exporter BacE [Thermoflexales bacterium]